MALASLTGDREFRRVRQHGSVLRGPLFTLRVTDYRPRHGETWRPRAIIGIVVPKKTLRRAVDRNRARRRVREALRTLPGGLPPCRAILMPTPAVLSAPFPDLQSALTRVLAQVPGRVKRRAGAQGSDPQRQGPGRGGNSRAAAPVPAPMTPPAEDQP